MSGTGTPAIVFEDLTLGYDRHPAVHHLDGSIDRGALVALIGPNGAGKSTLLKGIAGMIRPLSGRVRLAGRGLREIAHLPQIAEIDRSFPLTVYDFVAFGLWRRVGSFFGVGARERSAIETALGAVGLTGFEARPIGTLSGGQMQRAMFARLVLQDAAVILLDEPFNAVDRATVEDLTGLVRRWHDEGRTVVAVLHDFDLVARLCPEALLIAREAVAFGETAAVMTPDNLALARRMIEAFDASAAVCRRPAA